MSDLCRHQYSPHIRARDYLSGQEFAVHRCSHCGLQATQIEQNPVVDEAFYPDAYYGQEQRYNRFFTALLSGLIRYRLRGLSRHLANTKTVLDVGCGPGWLLDHFRTRGFATTGIEVSHAAAFHAKKILGLEILVGETSLDEIQDGSQDLVVLWHVLEHVSDPVELLKQIKRVMRQDGVLLLGVPNAGSPEARMCKASWFHLDVPRHLLHFNRRNLKQLIEATGLRIDQERHFVPEYDYFSFVQSLQNKVGLPQNRLYKLIRRESLGAVQQESNETSTQSTWLQDGLVCFSFPVLLVLSIFWVPLAALTKQGSSMTVVVRKDAE